MTRQSCRTKETKIKKHLVLLLFCVTPFVRAETIGPALIKDDVCGFYNVVHINGINTLPDAAATNLNAIAAAYGNAHFGHRIKYGLAYNQTRGAVMDVQQAYQQILFQFPGTTYGDWLGHVFNWLLPEWITESTIAGITSKLATVLVWRKPDVFFDSDLTSMMSAMSSLGFLNERSRMLIVGHSHGSIYANLIHRRMTALKTLEPQQFRLMSIAAFVPRIEGGGSFVTNRNDLPVNAGRAVFSDVLAGTVTIANNEGTSLERGHNLIKQYLRDSGSLDQIKLNMKAEMDRLGSGSRQPSPVWQITYPPVVYNKVYWDGFCSAGAPCQRSASNGDPYATITFTQPYYEYGVINQAFVPYTGMVYKTGTLEQAKAQALANALVCYRAARDETVRLRKLYPYGFGPQYSFNTISGCAQNLGHWAGVWFAVSGDSTPVFRTSYYYGGTIDTTAGAVCKRS